MYKEKEHLSCLNEAEELQIEWWALQEISSQETLEHWTKLHWWPTHEQQIGSIQINCTCTDSFYKVCAIATGLEIAQLRQDKCKGFICYPDRLYAYTVILVIVCCVIYVLLPVKYTNMYVFVHIACLCTYSGRFVSSVLPSLLSIKLLY